MPAATRALARLAVACTLGVVGTSVASPQQAPPSTDIFAVAVDELGAPNGPRFGDPIVVADRDGYDNQPAFLDGGAIVYSSRGGGDHTEILRWDRSTRATTTVVSTPQSEYSPTPLPGVAAISVVRDYGGGDQQLWRFPIAGGTGARASGEPALLLPDVNPVGYHAWIDERRVLLFVLGDPATLQIATVGPGRGRVLAQSPGRCLARIPAAAARSPREMSFVRKLSDNEWWLEALDPDADTEANATRRLVRTLPGREDYAWAPDGSVWMADGGRLFRWRATEATWSQMTDFSARGLRVITRLAFDAEGTSLALVAER